MISVHSFHLYILHHSRHLTMFIVSNNGFGTLTLDWKDIPICTEVTGTVKLPQPYHELEVFLHRDTNTHEFMVISNKPLRDDVNMAIYVVNADAVGTFTELIITEKTQSRCLQEVVYKGRYGHHASLLSGSGVHYRVRISCPLTASSVVDLMANLNLAF